MIRIMKAVIAPFKAICFLSSGPKLSTMDKYTGESPMGLTSVKSVENARMEKAVISFITFFQVRLYPVLIDH